MEELPIPVNGFILFELVKHRKHTTAIKGLWAYSRNLEALIARNPKPGQNLLQRKMANLMKAWDDFANAYDALFSVMSDDKLEDEQANYHAQSAIYNEALDKATVLEASYQRPVSVLI